MPGPTVAASRAMSRSAIRRTSGIADVVRSFAGDRRTRAVALYAEGFQEGRALAQAIAAVVHGGTPVVLLSPGRSAASVSAARSHTGSLAPRPAVLDAVCRATGALRVDTPRELFEITVALASAPRARGRRVTVVTEGGGHGGIAADALAAAGLEVPELGGCPARAGPRGVARQRRQ